MRRAALYAWNRGALVIVDDGEPPVIVFAEDIHDTFEADPDALARLLAAHGAERLLLAEDAGRPEQARLLMAAMEQAWGSRALDYVLEPARKAHRGAARKLCPPGSGSEATRDALAMVLADMGPKVEPSPAPPSLPWGPPTPALVEALCGPVGGHTIPFAALDGDVIIGTAEEMREGAHHLRPHQNAPAGPRVAGIDPGERWIAVEVGAVTGNPSAPLSHVAWLQVEVERTGKGQPTDEQLDAAVGKAVDFCELHGVERVAVERAVNVHRASGKSAEQGAGLAAYLLRGQYVAGMLRGALRAARREGGSALIPGRVESVSSVKGRNHVRRLHILGALGHKGPAPANLKAMVVGKGTPWQPAARAAFGGTIPAGVGEHVLDAAVCAVWAVRPEEAPAPPRAPREPGAPGKPRAGGSATRKAKTAAKRAAAGCRCEGRAHVAGCPIGVAANAKRAAAMVGNGNARRA